MKSSTNILPSFLKKGDRIGITCTARSVKEGELDNVIKLLADAGFEAVLSDSIYAVSDRYAGEDAVRTKAFQEMMDDGSIDAILCARGGYGTARMIDGLDWTNFLQYPKWICGYSDVSVMHSHVNKLGVASIHSTMGGAFTNFESDNLNFTSLIDELSGKPKNLHVAAHKLNRTGEVEAEMTGGNLAVLSSILGSPSDTDWSGKILLIEDVLEYVYNIDRIMLNLKRNGRLEKLAGLVVGDFSERPEDDVPFGKSMYEVIAEHVSEYEFPVAFGFPIGHEKTNLAIRLGDQVRLSVHSDSASIAY